jgi:hypothetical protein
MEMQGIDTHSLYRQFEAAGFTPPQAEATVSAFQRVIQYNLVTKQDLAKFELSTQHNFLDAQKQMKEMDVKLSQQIKEVDLRINQVEANLRASMSETKADLVKWMMGGFITTLGLQTALISLLLHFFR